MPFIDLHFPVLGSSLPTDHAYALYGALSRLASVFHEEDCCLRIGPIRGEYTGNGQLRLERVSRLRLRLNVEDIPKVLCLAGKKLDVDGHSIRLGVPQVRALIPAPALVARMVTIKGFTNPAPFLEAIHRQLKALEIPGEAAIPLVANGPNAGQPRRKVLRIKDRRVVGHTIQVTALTAEESIKLQEHGLGGRGKMGCGFFVAMR